MKTLLLCLSLLVTSTVLAQPVCTWENRENQPFETYGYTWGGGNFSTFEECQRVVRVTIIALSDYFKDYEGTLTFIEPETQTTRTCYLKRTATPWIETPAGFNELVYEAFYGRSNPQAFDAFSSYLDSNFSEICK